MTDMKDAGGQGRRLWQKARAGWLDAQSPGTAPDALDLAAYLDGTAGPQAGARMEAWLARSPETLETVAAAREALAEAAPAAPPALVARARNLVRDRAPAAAPRVSWAERLLAPLGRPSLSFAAAAAATLLVAVSAFELGRAGTVHLAATAWPAEETVAVLGWDQPADDLL